jgi:hypothetical protein
MGCCKIDRSHRSLNIEIGVLGVSDSYRLLEAAHFFSQALYLIIAAALLRLSEFGSKVTRSRTSRGSSKASR